MLLILILYSAQWPFTIYSLFLRNVTNFLNVIYDCQKFLNSLRFYGRKSQLLVNFDNLFLGRGDQYQRTHVSQDLPLLQKLPSAHWYFNFGCGTWWRHLLQYLLSQNIVAQQLCWIIGYRCHCRRRWGAHQLSTMQRKGNLPLHKQKVLPCN